MTWLYVYKVIINIKSDGGLDLRDAKRNPKLLSVFGQTEVNMKLDALNQRFKQIPLKIHRQRTQTLFITLCCGVLLIIVCNSFWEIIIFTIVIMLGACFEYCMDTCDCKLGTLLVEQRYCVAELLRDWKRVVGVRYYRGSISSGERKDDEGIYPISLYGCINLRLPPPRPVLEPVIEQDALPASDAVPVATATSVVTESNNIVLNV